MQMFWIYEAQNVIALECRGSKCRGGSKCAEALNADILGMPKLKCGCSWISEA